MVGLQPDQTPVLWDNHVSLYEEVFEPFTQDLALETAEALGEAEGSRLLDCAAGSGGAALALAKRGYRITAADASAGMVRRIQARACSDGIRLPCAVMAGERLGFADASFDAALSIFGVVLFPDPLAGLLELRRTTKPGGNIGAVTWTAPEDYELASRLRAAAASILGILPSGPLPAQLRFKEADSFYRLFQAAGLERITISPVEAYLRAPSPSWLSVRIAFAPGMAAMLAGFGDNKTRILTMFEEELIRDFGEDALALKAKAFIGCAIRPKS
jgi:SAM-dependent methyltransferase